MTFSSFHKLSQYRFLFEELVKRGFKKKYKTILYIFCGNLVFSLFKDAIKEHENHHGQRGYCDFPSEHWTRIRTNNVIERLTGKSVAALVW